MVPEVKLRHWSRYGVNGALEMTFVNYEKKSSRRQGGTEILKALRYIRVFGFKDQIDRKYGS